MSLVKPRIKPRRGGDGRIEDEIKPVKRGLQVEIVPEAVAVDEGVGPGRLLSGKEVAETGELDFFDGPADHLLDFEI